MIDGISALGQTGQLQGLEQSKELDKDAFMTLLVEQMKSQDPINPQANEDFIAQLASFSTLEQMEALNENFTGLAVLQQANALMDQLTQSSRLIGQTIEYTDPLHGTGQTGVVESVKIENGLAVLNIGGKSVPLIDVTQVLGEQPLVEDEAPVDDEVPAETE